MVGQGRGEEGFRGPVGFSFRCGIRSLCCAFQTSTVESSSVQSGCQLSTVIKATAQNEIKMKNDTKNLSNIRFRRAGQRNREREGARGRTHGNGDGDGKQDKE